MRPAASSMPAAPTPAVTALSDQAADAAITTACRTLFMPTIRDQAAPMAVLRQVTAGLTRRPSPLILVQK